MDERKSAEYNLGCAASAINFMVGSILLFFLIIVPSYSHDSTIVWLGVIVCLAVILNFVGFRVSSRNLKAGGAIMIVTALPLLISIIIVLGAPKMVWWLIVILAVWLAGQLLSIAAGIKCFVSSSVSNDEQEEYIVRPHAETSLPPEPPPEEKP